MTKEQEVMVALGLMVPEGARIKRANTGTMGGADWIYQSGEWYWINPITKEIEICSPMNKSNHKILSDFYLGKTDIEPYRKMK